MKPIVTEFVFSAFQKQINGKSCTMKTTIKQQFITDYNEFAAKYPKVLCGTCYRTIYLKL